MRGDNEFLTKAQVVELWVSILKWHRSRLVIRKSD
jgi:hypothetical protein